MAITVTTAMPTSFKVELLKGLHDLQNGADTLKIALYIINSHQNFTTFLTETTNNFHLSIIMTLFQKFHEVCFENGPFFTISRILVSVSENTPYFANFWTSMRTQK